MRTNSKLSSTTTRQVRRLASATALSIILGASFAACSSDGSSAAKKVKTPAPTVAVAPSNVGGATTGGGVTNTGGQTNTGQSGSGQTNTGQSGNGQSTGPAPTITSFTTPDNIDCHNGNLQNFSASWTTTNAVKTTISIDGPGVYKSYGANDNTSLPFNCSSSHTFLLTAVGANGHTVTRSITLQPRNVQSTSPDSNQP